MKLLLNTGRDDVDRETSHLRDTVRRSSSDGAVHYASRIVPACYHATGSDRPGSDERARGEMATGDSFVPPTLWGDDRDPSRCERSMGSTDQWGAYQRCLRQSTSRGDDTGASGGYGSESAAEEEEEEGRGGVSVFKVLH